MSWTVRGQVRFMAALANGEVLSEDASTFLLATMHPIRSHAWGLGTVGATSYKGGWLDGDSVTRQMGVVNGCAVAIITYGVGLVARHCDGDSAHVEQPNTLAGLLDQRLGWERTYG